METNEERFTLALREVRGGTKDDFARVLEPMTIPETDTLLGLIQQKIREKDAVFSLHKPISNALAKVASEMVRDSPSDYDAQVMSLFD